MKRKRRAVSAARVDNRVLQRPRLRRRRKVVFSFIAVLLALLVLEGASRVLVQLAPNARWENIRTDVIALGFPALSEVFVGHPTLFWTVKPNLHNHLLSGRFANSPPIRFSVSTDSDGLRRMPAVNSVRHRILFLGDSCTFGVGVEDHETFPALLQSGMEGVQCINAAVPGYTAYQGRVLLEQLELDAPPAVVVITFGRNDDGAWDHLSDLEHAELMAAERSRLINHFRFVQLLRHILPQGNRGTSAEDRPQRLRLTDAEYIEQIRLMIRWCRDRGAEPILLVWPEKLQMPLARVVFSKQLALMRFARSEGVRLVNLVPVFRARGGQGLFLDVVHARPAGCELVADTLLPVLQEVLGTSGSIPHPCGSRGGE